MKWSSRSSHQKLKMPTTQIYHLLDEQLTLVVRAWGSQEYNQKLIDEVSYYMSSAQADLDVTSPFDFKENLTSLANKTRIAVLLAQDHFNKTENQSEFTVGFEAVVLFQLKNELAWSSVGRFSLKKIQNFHLHTIFEVGTGRDDETLLPVELLGVEREVEINSGSINFIQTDHIILTSTYGGNLVLEKLSNDRFNLVPSNDEMTYWYSVVNAG